MKASNFQQSNGRRGSGPDVERGARSTAPGGWRAPRGTWRHDGDIAPYPECSAAVRSVRAPAAAGGRMQRFVKKLPASLLACSLRLVSATQPRSAAVPEAWVFEIIVEEGILCHTGFPLQQCDGNNDFCHRTSTRRRGPQSRRSGRGNFFTDRAPVAGEKF